MQSGSASGPRPARSTCRSASTAAARPTCSRCSRTPPASCTWGTSATTRSATSSATSGAARGHRCCARWATTRSGFRPRTPRSGRAGIPATSRERNIADDQRADAAHGLGDRLGPRGLDVRAGVLPLDAVALPALLREGPRLPEGGAGQVVPERPDGARERAGRRRALRALRRQVESKSLEQWFFRITDYADRLLDEMELLESVARARADDAAQLDRPLATAPTSSSASRAAPGSCPVFTTRPDTLFGATFFVLAPEHPLVGRPRRGHRARGGRCSTTSRARAARSTVEREAKEKDGVFTGRYAVNPVNGERDPDLGRRLRADGVRHRRDHGGARRTTSATTQFAERYGLEIRQVVAPAGGRRQPTRAPTSRTPRTRCSSTRASSPGSPAPEGKQRDRRLARRARPRRGDDRLPAARLAALAPALLGLPDPDRPLRRVRHRAGARRPAAGAAAGDRRLPAEGTLAARGGRGVGARHVPEVRRRGAARDRHDGHVRRLVLVLPALRRPARTTPAPFDRADRRLLAARQPVHRRHRARDPAPALRALLHEGAERHRICSASASRSRACSRRG